jgi:hypothetical protein
LLVFLSEVHAPILGLWGVKFVVIAVFLAFTLASIVSHLHIGGFLFRLPTVDSLLLNN